MKIGSLLMSLALCGSLVSGVASAQSDVELAQYEDDCDCVTTRLPNVKIPGLIDLVQGDASYPGPDETNGSQCFASSVSVAAQSGDRLNWNTPLSVKGGSSAILSAGRNCRNLELGPLTVARIEELDDPRLLCVIINRCLTPVDYFGFALTVGVAACLIGGGCDSESD